MQNFEDLFAKVDQDQDDILTAKEAEQLMAELEIPLYPGMINNLIDHIKDEYSKDQNISKGNIQKICSYHVKGFGFLIEAILATKYFIATFRQQLQQKYEENGISNSGASPEQLRPEQSIKAKIQVGQDTEYTNKIVLEITKSLQEHPGPPTVILKLKSKPQKIKQLISTIQNFIDTTKNLCLQQLEQYSQLINSIQIQISQQSECSIAIKVQSACQYLNQFLESINTAVDQIADSDTKGHLKFIFESGANFKSVLEGENSSMFDILLRKYRTQLQFKGSPQMTKMFEEILTWADIFDQVRQQRFPPYKILSAHGFALLALAEDADIDLKFNDVPFDKEQIIQWSKKAIEKNKNSIIQQFADLIKAGQDDPVFSYLPEVIASLNEYCDSCAQIDIKIGKIHINADVKLQDLGCLYKKILSFVPANVESE